MIRTGQLAAGHAVSNRAALHYINGKLAHRVADAPDAAVYWVEKERNGKVRELKEEVKLLPGPGLILKPTEQARRKARRAKRRVKA
jgi:hypothetical protein